ncbi:MAG: SDR family oxidoreductase [Rhodospirillales bacterium]|nr:SDR family oxidoreductase [Rhodospirillales bacterium]
MSRYDLINNAGILTFNHIVDLSLDDWNHVLGVNLTGFFTRVARRGPPHDHAGHVRFDRVDRFDLRQVGQRQVWPSIPPRSSVSSASPKPWPTGLHLTAFS